MITLEQAIKAYTLGAAYSGFRDKESGSLEVGKAADIIILDHDLFSIDPMDISSVQVTATIIDGKILFRRPV